MKKIIMFASAIILVLVFIQLYQLIPIGLLGSDGYALTDNTITKKLQKADLGSEKKAIEPIKVNSTDTLYERMGKYYVGEEKTKINTSYPIFANNATALMSLDDNAVLFTTEFEKKSTYNGLYISKGTSFNQDKERADNDTFIVLSMKNGLNINLDNMVITTQFGQQQVVMNAIVNFNANFISYYSIHEGKFVPNKIIGINHLTTIQIGDALYNYYEFLDKIGKLSDEKNPFEDNSTSQSEKENESKPEPIIIETNDTQSDVSSKEASSKKDESISSESESSDTDEKETSSVPTSTGTTTSPLSVPDKSNYIEPKVTVAQFTSDVYSIYSSIKIEDPQSRIKRGVKFEIRLDGKEFIRKVISNSGNFTIGPLQPGKEYKIVGSYNYKDVFGIKREVKCFEQTISTLTLDNLEPVELLFENGQLFYNKIQLKNVKFLANTNGKLIGEDTIPYVEKLELELNKGKPFSLDVMNLTSLKKGEAVIFETQSTLESNTEYNYSFALYDRFGNKLPTINKPTGNTRTCKAPPSAIVKLITNDIGKTVLKVDLNNKDNVKVDGCSITILNSDGNAIYTVASVDGDPSQTKMSHSIPSDQSSKVTISNLSTSKAYTAVISAIYDNGDGKYVSSEYREIGRSNFVTKSINTLGNMYFIDEVLSITENSAKLNVTLDKTRTNELLQFLISDVQIEVKASPFETVKTVALTKEELVELKKGTPITIDLADLKSCTKYSIDITAEATQGDDTHTIRSVYPVLDFMTLKKEPKVLINDVFATSTTIDLFNIKIDDPDYAILSNVTLQVKDSKNIVRSVINFNPNQTYDRKTFTQFETNETYTFMFYAVEYNNGESNDTFVALKELTPVYTVQTKEGLSGEIRLQGLSSIDGDANHYNADFKITVNDKRNELKINPKYYIKIFKNDTEIETIEQNYNGGMSQVDKYSSKVDDNSKYRFEIHVRIFDYEIKLAETEFTTEEEIIGFSNEKEMIEKMNAKLNGKFIALDDITWTRTSASQCIGGGGGTFHGTVDFQGYKLINKTGNMVFDNIGKNGRVKNIVVDAGFGAYNWRGILVQNNYGVIENIVINFLSCTNRANTGIGMMVYDNRASGVIQNFVVNIQTDVYAATNIGTVSINRGIIRNGYIYSNNGSTIRYSLNSANNHRVGGITGVTTETGITENVFSLIDIIALDTPSTIQQGCIVGDNGGVVRNSFSVGNVYRDDAKTITYSNGGPAIGGQYGKSTSNTYYVSNKIYTNTFNSVISRKTLYDREWYNWIINNKYNQFIVEGIVSSGYFPQVKLPNVMPSQDFIPLPELSNKDNVDLLSAVVTEQQEDYAIATFSFNNPDVMAIKSVLIEQAETEIIGKQTQDDKISRVTVKIKNPKKFLSSYNILSFEYFTGVLNNTSVKTYDYGERTVKAEFFKPIQTTQDWYAIDPVQNYKLLNDLDFENIAANKVCIEGTFTGKINGNNFTISNIDTSDKGYVFRKVTGEISNFRVEDLTCNSPKSSTNLGFISELRGSVNNIHLKNVYMNTSFKAGALVGLAQYAAIQNCSVTNVKIDSFAYGYRVLSVGGLIGQANTSTVSNVYAQNMKADVTNVEDCIGVGGIIGYSERLIIQNAYATGEITTQFYYAGGIVGRNTSGFESNIKSLWSNVKISSNTDCVGGLLGRTDEDEIKSALVMGSILTSYRGANNVNTAVGMSMPVTKLTNVCAVNSLTINNEVPAPADTITILSDAQLKDPDTYTKIIKLGDNFDYSRVSEGVLPKLYYVDSTVLLPNQEENQITVAEIEITKVRTGIEGMNRFVQVEIRHSEGIKIKDVKFDYLNISALEKSETKTQTILKYYISETPQRYLDNYKITSIVYTQGESAKEYEKIELYSVNFEKPFFIEIRTTDEWIKAMNEHGQTFENFRILNDLDFTGKKNLPKELKINRLVGPEIANQTATLKNMQFNDNQAPRCMIATLNAQMDGVSFDSFNLTTKSNTPRSGIISTNLGNIQNVSFSNITIKSPTWAYVGTIGYNQGVISNVKLENVSIEAPNCSQVGALTGQSTPASTYNSISAKKIKVVGKVYVGGVVGLSHQAAQNSLFDITVDDVDVTATDNFCGGILGYNGGSGAGNSNSNKGFKGTNLKIKGTNYVGGLFGRCYFINEQNFTQKNQVSDAIVIGTGNNVGGIVGQGDVYNGETNNCKVFGSSYIGGITGNGVCYYTYTLDSTISSIYDPKFIPYGNRLNATDANSQNLNIGGANGEGQWGTYSAGVVNCTVGAENAKNVGGFSGNNQGGITYSYVLDTNVYGKDNIGGLIGNRSYGTMTACYSNASVVATGINAGGLIGQALTDSRNTFELRSCYYVGTVQASNYAGGLVGKTISMNNPSGESSSYGVIVAANVVTTSGTDANINANIVENDGVESINKINRLVIYDGSSVTTNGEKKKITEIYSDELLPTKFTSGSGPVKRATTAEFKTPANYPSWLIKSWYFSVTPDSKEFMPYVKCYPYWGSSPKIQPYQAGKDNTGKYNEMIAPFKGGIPVPSFGSAKNLIMKSFAFNPNTPIPKLDVYAISADKLNFEFDVSNECAQFVVMVNGNELFNSWIDNRVYTLQYDFKTKFEVIITNGGKSQYYSFSPKELRRDIMTYGDNYYYLDDLGLQSSQGVLAGNFIHIYNGMALSQNGGVFDVSTGKNIGQVEGISLCEQSQPLYKFEYDGYQIHTYKNFSQIDKDQLNNEKALKLLVKNNQLSVIDPIMEVSIDGIILDYRTDKEYMTVLTNDGTLLDLKDKIVVPKDFKNSKIVQLTNTLNSNQPYLLVRYENGNLDGFNYQTGERIKVQRVTSDMSLFAYAKDYMNSKFYVEQREVSDGFIKVEELKKQLTINPILEELTSVTAESVVSDSNGSSDATNNNQNQSSSSETLQEASQGNEAITEQQKPTSDIISDNSSDTTLGQESSGNEGGLTTEEKNHSVVGSTNVGGKAKPNGTSNNENLSKKEEIKFIAVYGASAEKYQLYDENEILNCEDAKPASVEEKIRQVKPTFDFSSITASKKVKTDTSSMGIIIFGVTAGAILVLLWCVSCKKKK